MVIVMYLYQPPKSRHTSMMSGHEKLITFKM